jgi:acetyl esterase/lipase
MADAVRNVYEPAIVGAAQELPAALAQIRLELGTGDGPLALVGGSAGAAVAQLVLTESALPIGAAVLISPLIRLHDLVAQNGAMFGVQYPWDPDSEAIAARLDFVARAGEIAARDPQPPVLLITGEDDTAAILDPARALADELRSRYRDRAAIAEQRVRGMAHGLAEQPGMNAAPQLPHAAIVDGAASLWLNRWLGLEDAT